MSQTDMRIAMSKLDGIFMRKNHSYRSYIALAQDHSKLSAEEIAYSQFETDCVNTSQRKKVSAIAIIGACAMTDIKTIGKASTSA